MQSTDYLIKDTCAGFVVYKIVDDSYQYIGLFDEYPSRAQLEKGEQKYENHIG